MGGVAGGGEIQGLGSWGRRRGGVLGVLHLHAAAATALRTG